MKTISENKTNHNEISIYYHSNFWILKYLILWKKYNKKEQDKYIHPGWNLSILNKKGETKTTLKFFYIRMIYRNDNENYLLRYNLFECDLFSVKIHKIIASDDQCPHDHPWPFISIILRNGYKEYKQNGTWKTYKPISIIYRPAHWIHRLEITKPAWTFVITFKRIRKWGFYTDQGWIHWKLYSQKEHCN